MTVNLIKWLRDRLLGGVTNISAWAPVKPQDWRCSQCGKVTEVDHDANRGRLYDAHESECTREFNYRYIIDEDYDSLEPRFIVSYCELIWSDRCSKCVWKKHDSCVVNSEEEAHAWANKHYPRAHYDTMIGGG